MIRKTAALVLAFWGGTAHAVDLSLPPGSRLISDRGSAFDSYALPVGAFSNDAVPSRIMEGRVDRQSWRVDSASITTLQLLDPLRDQLSAAGFQTVFECAAEACGGFDFRFGIEVIPAPDMYVDIRDFRFFAAEQGTEAISLVISRSRTAGYIQIIQVSPVDTAGLAIATDRDAAVVPETAPSDLAAQLLNDGHVVLSDLLFETGTTELSAATYPSLEALAEFLTSNPSAGIALVGHSDATGDLNANIVLSRRRAESVKARLVETFGIAATRVDAEGMGYLAPRASNLTEDGRAENRRVEAILLTLD